MRNVLAKVAKGHDEMVAATIRTIFAQPGQAEVRAQVDLVADMLHGRFPTVAEMLLEAKADLTAFADFPHAHWRRTWSTNPLSVNREVKRRTDVVGIFPNPARPAEPVQLRAHRGPRRVARNDRRYLSEASMALLNPPTPTVLPEDNDVPPDLAPGDRRYGIVALTRRTSRDGLHHSLSATLTRLTAEASP